MREIRLHDTLSGEVLPLRPRDPGKVGIYACGPTVYSRIHIGNARPFVVFSLLKRFLIHEGYEVKLVINVTDVNDKIYDAARAAAGRKAAAGDARAEAAAAAIGDGQTVPLAIDSAQLAAEMTSLYVQDTNALHIGRPDAEPIASQTIEAIVRHIAILIETGHAYASGGDVFFDIHSDPLYGVLSHRKLEDMDQGEGVEGVERKRHALDFALWKAQKEGEDTAWDPRHYLPEASCPPEWAQGRPGWHIECSAMAESLLGVGFDIHGGGSDLVFPHHENEASQTRAARGQELAKIWMHNGMIRAGSEKMAKSLGNIAPLHDVVERWGREATVMYLIGGHYRQPLAFSESELAEADRKVGRIEEATRRLEQGKQSPPEMAVNRDAFFDALAEDFNTPKALGSLFEWVREANRRGEGVGDSHLKEMLAVLGLEDLTPTVVADPRSLYPEAWALAEERQQARQARDYARADALRDQIRAHGVEVRDGANGFELVPIELL